MQHYCIFSQSILNRTVQHHNPVTGSSCQPWSNRDCFVFLTMFFFFFFVFQQSIFCWNTKKARQGSEKPSMGNTVTRSRKQHPMMRLCERMPLGELNPGAMVEPILPLSHLHGCVTEVRAVDFSRLKAKENVFPLSQYQPTGCWAKCWV